LIRDAGFSLGERLHQVDSLASLFCEVESAAGPIQGPIYFWGYVFYLTKYAESSLADQLAGGYLTA
jgi:hypothetical protein